MATANRAPVDHVQIAKRRRRRTPSGMVSIRLGEINRLLRARYGELLPDTPDTRRAVVIVAHHLAGLPQDPRRSIPNWISLRAPWYAIGDVNALVLEVVAKPRRWKAHTLGWQLKLLAADRQALGIKSIGCVDATPAQRAAARAEGKRLARLAAHRAQGAKPRAEYLAAVARPKPWKAAGVSRRTWYRRQAARRAGTRGTGFAPNI